MIELSSKDVWRAVLGELELQVPKPSFEAWLRQTEGLNHDDSRFVVGVPTPFAVEWLELRMYQSIHRAVERVVRRPLDVQFQVKGQAAPGAAETGGSPGDSPVHCGGGSGIRNARGGAHPRIRQQEAGIQPTLHFFVLRGGAEQSVGLQRLQGRGGLPGRGIQPIVHLLGRGFGQDSPVACHRPPVCRTGRIGVVRNLRAVHQ